MKGGVGKTTMSVNICDCLSVRLGYHVLLVDIDPQFNATQCLMSGDKYVEHLDNEKDTILTVFERNSRPVASTVSGLTTQLSKQLNSIEVIQIKEGFDLLPGNLELYRLEMNAGDGRENRLKNFLLLQEAKNLYDYIIIDTPPTPSVWMTSALLASNYYLIPVKPDPLSLTGIDLLQGIIDYKKENFGMDISCAGVILTMVDNGTIVFRQAKEYLLKGRWASYLYPKSMLNRTAIARTQTNQGFILDLSDSDAKLALTGIVNELILRTNHERDK